MSYTTVYRFQDLNGYESVISKANSDMTYEGFGRILLSPGQTLEYKVTGEEQAIVLQQGDMTCWVEYEGVTVVDGAKGQRGNVYDDLPTALYVPPKATVKLYSEKGMEARVFTAYCEEGNAPYFCPPENIEGPHHQAADRGRDRVRARRLDRIPGAPARLRAPRQGVRAG